MIQPNGDQVFAMRGFDRSLPMVLLRSREAAMSLFRPMLAANGLTEQQWRVLRALASDRAPMDAGELADTTFLLASSLSRILTSLEREDLIGREVSELDRRRVIISLSGPGRELVAEVAPSSEAIYEELEDRFGADRLASLIAELDAFCEIQPSIVGRSVRRRRTLRSSATSTPVTSTPASNTPATSTPASTDHKEN